MIEKIEIEGVNILVLARLTYEGSVYIYTVYENDGECINIYEEVTSGESYQLFEIENDILYTQLSLMFADDLKKEI